MCLQHSGVPFWYILVLSVLILRLYRLAWTFSVDSGAFTMNYISEHIKQNWPQFLKGKRYSYNCVAYRIVCMLLCKTALVYSEWYFSKWKLWFINYVSDKDEWKRDWQIGKLILGKCYEMEGLSFAANFVNQDSNMKK